MRKIFLQCLILLFFFTLIVPCADAHGGVVLVLSGGGTRGLAHIGVLKVFEEHGIRIEGIVGTSMGSLVGGLYSCGYSAAELENMLAGLDLTSLLYDRQREADAPPGEQGDPSANSLFRLELDKDGHITGPLGGLDGKRLLEKLQEWTSVCPVLDFAELHFPFAAVATDIVTGEAVVLNKGNLASAMRASMAIPGLFSPWTVDGRLLVDGGLVSNAPVMVARDLFPGYPVIAVDVSGRGKERENIRTVVDVLDQMITIMTMRNVQEELKYADLVLTPEVGGLPMLDLAEHEDIIRSGESVATEYLEQIVAVASLPSPPSEAEIAGPLIVADIHVVGLGEKMSEDLRRRYMWWINREADPAAIIQACVELRQRDDVRTADYSMEYLSDGRAIVVLNIEKEPVWEISGGGYAANLDPYSSVYLDVVRRDLFSEGDSLKSLFGISENWQFSSRYLAPVEEGGRRWEISVKAGERVRVSSGGPDIEWQQYSAGVWRRFGVGSFKASLGYAGELISFGGQDHFFSGPTLALAWEGLDDPIDPAEGFSASLSLWWKDMNSLLATMRFLGVVTLEGDWRLYARGGAILGDGSSAYHAAWLGARGELYTMAASPIQAENAVWIGMGLRKVFLKSWWGTINLDLFATSGQTFDTSWNSGEKGWETGLALSLPGKIFNGKILVLYDDRSEWSFGFTIGRPLWEDDPLP